MYGLVNKAIEQLVTERFGEDVWHEIALKAGICHPFVMMKSYPDHVTFDLVAAASDILKTPSADILEAFGEHWIQYTVDEGYGKMMSLYGESVEEFLSNMDDLHAQIRLSFPELRPPKITCENLVDGRLLVRYESERQGLAPMLVGLIRGLGKRFCMPVEVEYVESDLSAVPAEQFFVSFAQQKAA